MQFSKSLAAAAMATVAAANYNQSTSAVWVTDVVTAYTTFCPASTTLTAYGQTYTVSSATTLTLPCPCTSSYLVTTGQVTLASTAASTAASGGSVSSSASAVVPAPAYLNSTTSVVTKSPSSTVVTTDKTSPSAAATSTQAVAGAASTNTAAGALLGALAFAVAYLA